MSGCSDRDSTDPVGPGAPKDSVPSQPNALVVAWLKSRVLPFETTVVREDRTDLAFLNDLVGDARIVALGEATHGTSEFFEMKHRILDFLAKEMDFRLFAMEATWPEMNRM